MNDKPLVLLAAPMNATLTDRMKLRYDVIGPPTPPFASSVDSLGGDVLGRVRAIVTIGTVKLDGSTLAKFPALGAVVYFGSGYEGLDIVYARGRGLVLGYSVGANAASVADVAIALMLEVVREIPQARARLYSGTWQGNARVRNDPTRGVTGRRLGIYGLGAIGEKIAVRGAALEMEIAYHNRRRRPALSYPYMASLLELATWCDVLMISVRADATNHHAVDASVLTALGEDGFVINISRGSVIDEATLADFLSRNAIAGAGLDVYEHEPKITPMLLTLPNVALTPHIGGLTLEAREAMENMVMANLDASFDGKPLPNAIP